MPYPRKWATAAQSASLTKKKLASRGYQSRSLFHADLHTSSHASSFAEPFLLEDILLLCGTSCICRVPPASNVFPFGLVNDVQVQLVTKYTSDLISIYSSQKTGHRLKNANTLLFKYPSLKSIFESWMSSKILLISLMSERHIQSQGQRDP